MPKPLNVDWPAVRVLAVAVGSAKLRVKWGSAKTRYDNARNAKAG
jgi:hypothetical protein